MRTRDHTEVALRAFGVHVERKGGIHNGSRGNEVRIRGGQRLRSIEARAGGGGR